MNRDTVVIAIICVAAIAVGAWLFFGGIGTDHSRANEQEVTFTVLAEGNYSGNFTERRNYRIGTQEEFSELWRMLYGIEAPPIPVVDFSKNEVLAVFDGTHSSGGYGIQVSSITDVGAKRFVSVTHTEPEEGCIVTQSVTSPFEIVMLSASVAAISREETTKTVSCQ